MKHTIEIELPDHLEPDGEPLADRVNAFAKTMAIWLPVRKVWHWPEWLTAKWIAMDEDGEWFGYEAEPLLCDCIWLARCRMIALSLTTFVPPPCTDWRQSKRRNPRSATP